MPKCQLVDGIGLHYEVVGPALEEEGVHTFVFVHGGPGILDSRSYRYWDRFASDKVRVLYIDQRGSGRSDDPDPVKYGYTLCIEQHAKDIDEFCRAYGLVDITIGGVSQGGYVSLSYALQFPDNTKGLIICDAEAKRDAAGRAEAYRKSLTEFYGLERDEVERLVKVVEDNDACWDEEDYSQLGAYYSKAGEEFVLCRHEKTLYKFFQEEFGSFDLTNKLPKITADVLYILGEYDCVHPPVSARETRDGMTNAASMTYHEIKDAGDPAYADKPEETASLVNKFFAKILACNHVNDAGHEGVFKIRP